MTLQYEKTVSVEEVVAIADDMWRETQKTPVDKRHELLEYFHKSRREICVAYPVVVKTMCLLNVYSAKVFAKYINHIKHRERKTEEDFLEQQATYMKMMYRAQHPKASQSDIIAVYNDALKHLREEAKEHKERVENAKKKFDARHAKYGEDLAKELAAAAVEGRLKRATDIVVEYNESN
jgi:hypothetical protein